MTYTEQRIAARIIRRALKAGFTVSVWDGEAYAIERSTHAAGIMLALGHCDSESLTIRNADGRSMGSILLIYGNGGDGEDLVADHSANPTIEALVA